MREIGRTPAHLHLGERRRGCQRGARRRVGPSGAADRPRTVERRSRPRPSSACPTAWGSFPPRSWN